MPSLLDMSPELLAQILENCESFPELFTLISVCKRLYSIWSLNTGSIIQAIGERSIAAFDDALMAIRATDVIKKASELKELPPHPFPLHSLSVNAHKPTVSELQSVFDMQHLARCLAHQILYSTIRVHSPFSFTSTGASLRPINEDLPGWEENFFRSVYRIIIAGAVCTRAYTEPFFRAAELGDDDFQNRWEQITWGGKVRPRDEEMESIRKYPAYNFDADDESEEGKKRDEAYHESFGAFGEWMVKDGKSRHKKVQPPPSQAPVEVADIARLMAVYEHNVIRIANLKSYTGPMRRTGTAATIYGRTRKVSVVMFGIFQVEEIVMPADVTEAKNNWLTAIPLGPPGPSINHLLLGLRWVSRRPETHNGYPSPLPILTVFVFILRRYLGKRFADQCFNNMSGVSYLELADPTVFCPHIGPADAIFVGYKPPVLTRVFRGPRD